MASSQTSQSEPKPVLGISARRVRGFLVLAFTLFLAYVVLFESDPPPSFREISVEIPERPDVDFEKQEFPVAEPETEPEPEAPPQTSDTIIEAKPAEPSAAPELTVAESDGTIQAEQLAASAPDPADEPEAAAAQDSAEDEGAQANSETQGSSHAIRLIALSEQDRANEFARRVTELTGWQTHVNQVVSAQGETVYRVWLGPFSLEQAQARLAELNSREKDSPLLAGGNPSIFER